MTTEKAALLFARLSCILLTTATITSCGTSNSDMYHGLNPVNISRDDGGLTLLNKGDGNNLKKYIIEQRSITEQIPYTEYYQSLLRMYCLGQKDNSNLTKCTTPIKGDSAQVKEAISDFITKGSNLVKINCSRWFDAMAIAQQKMALESSRESTLWALGHTLLGIGKANPTVNAVAGAMNTAYTGTIQDYTQAYLLAPNTKNVKTHIMAILDDAYAKKGTIDNISDAIRWMETYADYCTQSMAKNVIDNSLNETRSTIEASGGGIETYAKPAATQKAITDMNNNITSNQQNIAATKNLVNESKNQIDIINNQIKSIQKQLKINDASAPQ
ncbi:hypothetical protein LQR31_02745 [Chromobacterium vaccinii]|uniref:hypothetical protein n=1 Tax=Chromobacterium vaccinii TaxID=1108595 RepID=UPI001E3B6BD1|nr:hypothetical protein [Chromobacterium vaccinii]MCD4483389.1 hypothetical protein [Chromobacterium vaccinii]